MMSFRTRSRFAAPMVLAIAALGMSACTASEPGATATVTVTASSTVPPTEIAPEPTTASSSPLDGTPDPTAEPTGLGSVQPSGGVGQLTTTVVGHRGVHALQYSGEVPSGEAGPGQGKLILGPGGCLSLTSEDQPSLLVFGSDAKFVLGDGNASVSIDGTEYLVGDEFNVPTTVVPKSSLTHVPHHCAQGSADDALVVN